MKIVTSLEMEAIDKSASSDYAQPALLLMENAGRSAWNYFYKKILKRNLNQHLVFLAGKGNNGGDALVMARHALHRGYRPAVIRIEGNWKDNPAVMAEACLKLGIPVLVWNKEDRTILSLLESADWIIDGLAGTGLQGPLTGHPAELCEYINAQNKKVIAIDVPSGIGDQWNPRFPAIRVLHTLTMELPKICCYSPAAAQYCGKIHVCRVGFPRNLCEAASLQIELLQNKSLSKKLPAIPDNAYKNKRGHVAVFAGSVGTHGAAYLSSHAAARSTAGLVTLYTDVQTYPTLACQSRSIMVRPVDYQIETQLPKLSSFQSLLVGPGWGTERGKSNVLYALIQSGLPMVIDADGLTILHELLEKYPGLDLSHCIATPHFGEFSRLSSIDIATLSYQPLPVVQSWAKKTGCFVILKGSITYLASPDKGVWILNRRNAKLGTAGSGDVLAGIIAGLLGQGMERSLAAQLGVLVHSKAGRLAGKKEGWFLAEDLLPYVSRIFAKGN